MAPSSVTRFLVVRTIGLVCGGVLAAAITFALIALCKIVIAEWLTGTTARPEAQWVVGPLAVCTGVATAIVPRVRVLVAGTLVCALATAVLAAFLSPPAIGSTSPITWWLVSLLPVAAAVLAPYRRLRAVRFDLTSTDVWLAPPMPADSRGGRVFHDD